jgi:hypothetical protein
VTPFQQLRLWARRAPIAERVAALTAAALSAAAIAWLVVPAANHNGGSGIRTAGSASGLSSGGAGNGATNAGQSSSLSGGSASGTTGGSNLSGQSGDSASGTGTGRTPGQATGTAGPATGSSQTASGSSGSCVSPPGSDQGVTATQIKVAIIVNNLVGPAANSTFGLASAAQQQDDYQWAADAINASGGIACRKLVPVFFQGDAADPSNLQQVCLNVTQAQPFFVIDFGAFYTYPSIASCFPQAHIPFLSNAVIPDSELNQFYPYLFAKTSADVLYRNTVFALQQRGAFSSASGFHKLGVIYSDCEPQFPGQFMAWLNQAGLGASQIVTYDVGCPTSYSSPSTLEQAILKFKSAGVTDVTQVKETADFSNFTTIAEQQGFNPKYGIADDGIIAISYGSQHPDYQNIANAVAITDDRYGEEHTPGYPPSAATAKCNAIFAAHGQPPVYQQPVGTGGLACGQEAMMVAATDHAPVLERSALAAGLQAAQSVDLSYPQGPNNFSGSHVTYGDEYWRAVQFFTSCDCWRVPDPTFHPSFE